ncbi:TrmH family RNA methyltransferase [Lentisphaerota bacterium WC36G]|nr:hypothetical protein LJT99_10340 [Lentisphaerae bacterium WC36]
MNRENKNCAPKVVIVLDRLRSAFNTGNIFRIAEATTATEVICCGYTPHPPHPKLAKTAMGSDEMVNFRHFETSLEAVNQLRTEGFEQILAVENSADPCCAWDYDYQYPLALIFGNEALGVNEETLKKCDGIVSLPMLGEKASVNVGNCAAVVLYSVLKNIQNKKI